VVFHITAFLYWKGGIMHAPQNLRELVNQLQQAEVVPRPDGEEWKSLIDRISVPGTVAQVDEETYFYFLEVLPPKLQRWSLFAFAEGAEPLRLFWAKDEGFFCRQLTWDETQTFCRLARIPLPW
jgi:hypothetical protein